MSNGPKVISTAELHPSEARWVTLKKIKYKDQEGKERFWECAERKTRGSSGIDAVDVVALINSKTKSFPLSTIIIEQYRAPLDNHVIEFPAGLIDDEETAEEAAIRELEEETGYKADRVIESSQIQFSDPGTITANMKTVIVGVTFPDKLKNPVAKLDPGEFIITRVVELAKLNDELKAYDKKGFVVDARLSHFAWGYELAQRVGNDEFI